MKADKIVIELSKRCHVMCIYLGQECRVVKGISKTLFDKETAKKMFKDEAKKYKQRNKLETITIKILG